MISTYYPSPRPNAFQQLFNGGSKHYPQEAAPVAANAWWEKPGYVAQATTNASRMKPPISVEEWIRRDRQVYQHYTECKLKPHDIAVPTDPHNYNQYGKCLVLNVAASYAEIQNDKWNEDAPFVVLAQTLPEKDTEKPYNFVCTVTYLNPNVHLHDIPESEQK